MADHRYAVKRGRCDGKDPRNHHYASDDRCYGLRGLRVQPDFRSKKNRIRQTTVSGLREGTQLPIEGCQLLETHAVEHSKSSHKQSECLPPLSQII